MIANKWKLLGKVSLNTHCASAGQTLLMTGRRQPQSSYVRGGQQPFVATSRAHSACHLPPQIPGNAFNYTFMPMHMRIPFLATLSFGYCILLSMTRGDEKAGSVQVEAVEASENVEADQGTPIVGVTDLHVLPGDTADGETSLTSQPSPPPYSRVLDLLLAVTRHVVEFRPRVQVVRSTHS